MNEKLIKIQSELKAPKNQRNNFGNYNYRSCEDILEAVKPLLKDHGMTLVISDMVVNIGNHNYVQATATLNDGTTVTSASAFAREAEVKKGMDEAQITGAASSYARKYALNGLFAIDDTKDADSQDNTHIDPPKAKAIPSNKSANGKSYPASDKQRAFVQQLLTQRGISQEESKGYIIEQYGVEVPLTSEGAKFVIDELLSSAKDVVTKSA